MRNWGAWAIGLVVALGTWNCPTANADPPDNASQPLPPAGSSSLFSHWIGSTFKSSGNSASTPFVEPTKPKAEEPKASDPKAPSPASQASARDPIAERKKIRAAYLRRLNVCDQLQSIADATGDQALAQQAQELADRAGKVYEARIAHLPVPQAVAQNRPTTHK